MKKNPHITSSVLSFAPIVSPTPLTVVQKVGVAIDGILSLIIPLIFVVGSFSLIFFLLYQTRKLLKAKISHDDIKATQSRKLIKKGLLYLLIFLISLLAIKMFYLNCRYMLDYGVPIIDACMRP